MPKVQNRDILRNIKMIGKDRGKSLKDISLELDRHKNFLSTTISKKKTLISLDLLLDIAQILNCDIAELLVVIPEDDK